MARRQIASGLIASIVWSGVASTGCTTSSAPAARTQDSATPAAASASPVTPAPAALPPADAAAVREAGRQLAASAPPSAFDVDRKATELGADAERLFAFVRDNVRTEIYAGELRGARGTLIAGAGNAWDKAALLAALLRHHGRDVRFARGSLPPDRAARLVAATFATPASGTPHGPDGQAAAVVDRGGALISRIESRARDARMDVLAALERAGIALGQIGPVTDATVAQEAADHLWVEYRDGDRWIALDPTAASAAGEAATAVAETFAQIPEAMTHRVTFVVRVEQRAGQKLEEHDVLRWSAPAGDLHGVGVLLAHRMQLTPAGWLARPVLFVGENAYGAMSFDEGGVVLGAGGSGPGASLIDGAHRQVGGVGRIGEAFGSPASTPPSTRSELTAVTLDVAFTNAAGRTESVRRELLDRIGAVDRAQGHAATAALAPLAITNALPRALSALHACAITAGALDARFTAARLSSALAATADAQAVLNERGGQASAAGQDRLTRVLARLPDLLESTAATIHVLSQTLASRIRDDDGQLAFYESTPRLAIVSFEPALGGLTIDLRRNTLRVVGRHVSGAGLVRATLARGVLDAAIEDALGSLPFADAGEATPVSTVGVLARDRGDGLRTLAVRGGSSVDVAGLSTTARARITAAGDRQVIVLSTRPADMANRRAAWWQIDPSTGETIGVIDTGLHGVQPVGEYGRLNGAVASPMAQTIAASPAELSAYYQALAAQAAAEAQMVKAACLAGAVVGAAACATLAFVFWRVTK